MVLVVLEVAAFVEHQGDECGLGMEGDDFVVFERCLQSGLSGGSGGAFGWEVGTAAGGGRGCDFDEGGL